MNQPTRTRSKAFTFVEVLVALAIASIALLGLLRLHLLSMKTADAAQAMAQAVFLAQEQLAEASAAGCPRHGADSGSVEKNGLSFLWQTESADVGSQATGGLPVRGLRQIRCTVTWQQGADQKSLQMNTYVADTRANEHEPQ
ncbi:MAG: prepilin-type N-terminal cleavage/methylation domain-containing protein [Sedimentisphaerales bacterium]|nr:prepilin-type N-terminal cleavage/methylation domain-containing protein [Sedimentisphaerales bacterium]